MDSGLISNKFTIFVMKVAFAGNWQHNRHLSKAMGKLAGWTLKAMGPSNEYWEDVAPIIVYLLKYISDMGYYKSDAISNSMVK